MGPSEELVNQPGGSLAPGFDSSIQEKQGMRPWHPTEPTAGHPPGQTEGHLGDYLNLGRRWGSH